MRNTPAYDTQFESVRVEAPARLHLGFMDLNGSLGRRFGSLGLTLEGIATEIEVRPCRTLQVEGPVSAQARVLGCAATLIEKLGLPRGVCIRIHRAIPDHVGLGSGTQLTLAVAVALTRLYGIDLTTRRVAKLMNRGARSGIGIGAFDAGGFLIDGGRGARNVPPPVILHTAFPETWRLLLVFDESGTGIHGSEEKAAFRALPVFPAHQAATLCRLVMMQALPALAEQDCESFGNAISRLQQVVGDYFAPAQCGRYASPEVARVLDWLAEQDISGVGQSSWGPTGFAIIDSQLRADALLRAAEERFSDNPRLRFTLCRARNRGSRIRTVRKSASHMVLRAAM
ncbi:MAG TPA: GHMP kinase [Gammaproteobacteria bacterium]|nr:GHMP kinase [Gammaproteobacteria bacterium]